MSSVLIIDDASMMRNLLKKILASNGYEICADTADGREGIEKYKQFKPDIVFCDIGMPNMNGMDCLKEILAFDPNAKVVMCTALGKEKFADQAIEIGARSFILKPIRTNVLLDVTSRVLAGGGINYKQMMMDNSIKDGLSQKDVLDFFDAFRSLAGKDMDDLSVDHDFMVSSKASVEIGANAFLASKLSLDKINRLMKIFKELCD